jgi:proteasome lid subunit RPN8/RPN11
MSDSESNVRLSPPSDTTPLRSAFPKRLAQLWRPPFENEVNTIVSILVTSQAFKQFTEHGRSDLENEVGGGLVGEWREDAESGEQFVVVEASLPARFTRHGSAYLTFTQDTLVALNDELEEQYPGKQLVGWYHTHPRMGIFLSYYDIWLHEHFFPEPWQVALVIEPHAGMGGFFIRRQDSHLDPRRYFGFHELIEEGATSIVQWANMGSGTDLPVESGGDNVE